MASAMPCKRAPNDITKVVAKPEFGSEKCSKKLYECILESHQSTRQRVESSQSKNHGDHIADKGFNSMSHCNLVHKFIHMPQVMKSQNATAAVDKE